MPRTRPQLPVPPARLCQVVRATRDPDVAIDHVVRLISSDPGLTVELLRVANSAFYSPRRKMRSVAQATVFLGLRAVRNHAVAHVLKAVMEQVDLSGIDEARLWRDVVYRGAVAFVFAEQLGLPDPTEAFTLGVVLDAGFVMLVALRPDQAAALEACARAPSAERIDREVALTGTCHPDIYADSARQWGLPDELVDPVAYHHDPSAQLADPHAQRLLDIARLTDALIDARTGDRDAVGRFLELRRSFPALPRTDLPALFERIDAELPRLGDLLDVPLRRRRRGVAAELMKEAVAAMVALQGETLSDNRELRRQNTELDRAASEDPLTGAANRRGLQRVLGQRLAVGPTTVALFDLDHFKRINDNFGHDGGDDVLVATCRRVQALLRPGELLARWGGEEFAVVLDDAADADERVEGFRRAIADAPVARRDGTPIAVTASFGCTTAEGRPEDVLAAADRALYASKAAGRNRVTWAPSARANRRPSREAAESSPAGPRSAPDARRRGVG